MFSPGEMLIDVAYEPRRIPGEIADDIVAGRALHDESDRGPSWRWLALAGVGTLAAVSLVRRLPFKS